MESYTFTKPEDLEKAYENAAEEAKRLLELRKQSKKFFVDNVIPNFTVKQLNNIMLEKKYCLHRDCRQAHERKKV